jgi:hypothetical protein
VKLLNEPCDQKKQVPGGLLKKPGGRKKQGTGTRKFAAFPVPVFAAFALCVRWVCGARALAADPLHGFLSQNNNA